MAQRYPELSDAHIQFIARQKIFFVGTATAEGRVNVAMPTWIHRRPSADPHWQELVSRFLRSPVHGKSST
ncbi:MAG: pyridoxamine 5'-phosphate oxidase family protein [Nitrospiraceae bacterium]